MKTRIFTLLFAATGVVAVHAQTAAEEPADTTSYAGYEMLDEIVVKGERPVMQSDGAKLTYNVDEDPAADSSSALDMLKKVPQISVDGDGNIRLNGSTAFKIQVNGLDNPMLKQYSKQILEGMPASAISKIEVLTEPGAKEDAEGTAGIINIITERTQSKDGAGGSATLSVDNRTITPSLYGIMKKDKFTVSANVNYQWSFEPQKTAQDILTEYLGSEESGTLFTNVGQRSKHHYVGGSLNMSWEPNPSNLFTAEADIFYIGAKLPSLYGSTMRRDASGGLLWSFSQDGKGTFNILNVSSSISYRHNFGHDGNHLVLSYLFNFGRDDLSLTRWYPETENYDPGYMYQRQGSLSFDRGHTVQADYSNDFNSEHHELGVGVKGIFRHNTALADYRYGDTEAGMVNFPELDSDIMQPQNIYAAYATYTGSFNPLGVAAGVRYEHTLMGITDRNDPRRSFRNRLNDVVPNVALTWSFSPSSNLRLAYQMRISRPSIQQVNPFELSFTPYQVNRGNPLLDSERIHITSLKYSSFGRIFGGTVGVEYRFTDNAISSYTYFEQTEDVATIVTSFANIGKKQEMALTGLLTWNIISGMNFSLNGRLAYNKLVAPSEGYRNHGWGGNIGANWSYAVGERWKFGAYGAWFARNIVLQGYSSGYYYYGVSASRDFLADKSLTLSVSANNFAQSRISYRSETHTPQVNYYNTGWNLQPWRVGVSLTWKFGSLNSQVKKTGVEVKNDDINSSSNKSQAGGI